MEAARRAISSPLLEGASVNGARGVIINVTGGPDLSLIEVSEASSIVQEAADEDANIIFGAVVDPALKGQGQDHGDRDRLRSAPRRADLVRGEDARGYVPLRRRVENAGRHRRVQLRPRSDASTTGFRDAAPESWKCRQAGGARQLTASRCC